MNVPSSCFRDDPSAASQSTLPSKNSVASSAYSLKRATNRSRKDQSSQHAGWQSMPSKLAIGSHFGNGASGNARASSPSSMSFPHSWQGNESPARRIRQFLRDTPTLTFACCVRSHRAFFSHQRFAWRSPKAIPEGNSAAVRCWEIRPLHHKGLTFHARRRSNSSNRRTPLRAMVTEADAHGKRRTLCGMVRQSRHHCC